MSAFLNYLGSRQPLPSASQSSNSLNAIATMSALLTITNFLQNLQPILDVNDKIVQQLRAKLFNSLGKKCANYLQIYQSLMSRRRNRHRSLSNNSRMSQRSQPQSPAKQDKLLKTTAQSFYVPRHSQTHFNSSLQASEQLYNKNISFFRDNFNQNDKSQLPFMSSLRQAHPFKQSGAKVATICLPFEAALENTSNQLIKKKISDFSSKQTRLSGAYYRWHNHSGLNNKWAANFQCTLRDYGEQNQRLQKNFYPYVKPIVYNDVEETTYERAELICNRRSKSFKIR